MDTTKLFIMIENNESTTLEKYLDSLHPQLIKSINKLEINSQVYFNEQKEELSIINKNSNYKVSTAILNSNNELYFKSNSQKYIPNTKDTKGILNNDLVLISTYNNNLCKIIKIIKRNK